MKASLSLFLCLIIILSDCSRKAELDNVVDKIKLTDLNGSPIDLHRLKNKVVLINFWATWCAPCIAEMPSLQKAKEQLSENNIEFLLASNEPVDRITAFKERKKIELQFAQLENQEELGIQVLPTTYIIDSKGKLVFSEVGSRQWDSKENIEMLTKIINDND